MEKKLYASTDEAVHDVEEKHNTVFEGNDCDEHTHHDRYIRNNLRWDDQPGKVLIEPSDLRGCDIEEYRDTPYRMYFLKHNKESDIHLMYQLAHKVAVPVDEARLHLHYIPMALGAGNVYLSILWCWINRGEVLPALSGWSSNSKLIPIIEDDLYKSKISHLVTIIPSGLCCESTILKVYISRLTGGDLDTYKFDKDHGTRFSNFGIDYFDLHVKMNKSGSMDEYTV